MRTYTTEEIIERVKAITGDRFDSDLAERLGVNKQSFPQYKHKKTIDLQQKIISLLIDQISTLQK